MQANYRGDQFVVPILQRLGLCGPEYGSRTDDAPIKTLKAGPQARAALHALLKRMAPEPVVRRLRRRFGAASHIDWSRIQVFQLPTDRNSFLRVNLRGREPAGIIAAGKEYDALLTTSRASFARW